MAKIAIAGVAGRMGRTLVELAKAADGVSLVAGFEAADSPFLGQDVGLLAGVGALNVLVESDAQLRERERNLLRTKRADEAFEAWVRDVRGRAFVEIRDPG